MIIENSEIAQIVHIDGHSGVVFFALIALIFVKIALAGYY